MTWALVSVCDPRARALADRHYSRQRVGARDFVPPGRRLVLLTADSLAAWAVVANLDPRGGHTGDAPSFGTRGRPGPRTSCAPPRLGRISSGPRATETFLRSLSGRRSTRTPRLGAEDAATSPAIASSWRGGVTSVSPEGRGENFTYWRPLGPWKLRTTEAR